MSDAQQADGLEALAKRHDDEVAELRRDAIRSAGARDALADTAQTVVARAVERLRAEVRDGKVEEGGDRLVKRYLVQVQNDLLAASQAADTAHMHMIGKASGLEESAAAARQLAGKGGARPLAKAGRRRSKPAEP